MAFERQERRFENLETKLKEALQMNKTKEEEVIWELNIKINDLDRYQRRKNIEIYGVSVAEENENLASAPVCTKWHC